MASSLTTTTPDWFSPVGRYLPLRLCVFRQGLMTIPRVHWNPVRKSPSRRLALSRGVWPSIVALFARCKQASGPKQRKRAARSYGKKAHGRGSIFRGRAHDFTFPNFFIFVSRPIRTLHLACVLPLTLTMPQPTSCNTSDVTSWLST